MYRTKHGHGLRWKESLDIKSYCLGAGGLQRGYVSPGLRSSQNDPFSRHSARVLQEPRMMSVVLLMTRTISGPYCLTPKLQVYIDNAYLEA